MPHARSSSVWQRCCLLILGVALCVVPKTSALALLVESGASNTTAPSDDPGFIHVGKRAQFSAVYLGNGWVITANHVPVGPVEIDGTEVLQLSSQGLTVNVASIEGRLVLTTTEAGIADFGGSDTLKDDARFAASADAAGLPDETGGFAYVDIAGLLEMVTSESFLGSSELVAQIDEEAIANSDPLGTLLVYGTTSADEQRFAGLLTIE